MQAPFRCRPLAKPIMFVARRKPKRRKRARALHKAHSAASQPPRDFVQSGFNEVRYPMLAMLRRGPHRSL